jgi:geranylgeranyl diphosphate synthase type II
LAGDALLARAFEVLATDLSTAQAARAVSILSRAAGATALVGGQADDLADHHLTEAEKTGAGSASRVEHLESIHRRKTGALFTACLQLGGITAEAGPEQLAALECYAADFGLAFQIVDDLLDFLGSTDKLGKQTGKDIERGKLTFPGLLGVAASRRRASELTASACQAATLFGDRGKRLTKMANFVLERSR